MTFVFRSRKNLSGKVLFCLLLLPLVPQMVEAQGKIEYSEQAERLFAEALALFEKKEYTNASVAFGRVLQSSQLHQRTTAALVMRGKSDLSAGNLSGAEMSLKSLLREFPSSHYSADAEYTLGLVQVRAGSYTRALKSFTSSWKAIADQPKFAQLQAEVIAALDSTIDSYISLSDLQQFVLEESGEVDREFLLLKLAKKQLVAGHYNAATNTYAQLRQLFSTSSFPRRFSELQTMIHGARSVTCGVLLPLMKASMQAGREKEVGSGLLEGITLAFDEYIATTRMRKVSLDIRDSEGDPGVATAMLNELANDSSVIGVLGPAFSPEAFAVARAANEKALPIITPTANANGIAASGTYVFQANPDLENRARAMARYAVMSLQLKRVAVLASRETSSKSLADAFVREALLLGADVVTTEWYERGTTDLTQQMINVRRKAAGSYPYLSFNGRLTQKDLLKLNKLGVPMMLLDSLALSRSIVSALPMLGDDAEARLREQAIPFTRGHPSIDSLQHIVTTLDGLYCPINSPSEIGVVSSQVAYFGIATTLLGSGEWNNIAELNANQRYIPRIVFESDSYTDPTNPEAAKFERRFLQRFGRSPNRNNLYGYSVARVFFHALDRGVTTREQLRNALAEIGSFQALHSKVSFSARRVNAWLHILLYSDGAIRPASEIEVP